MTDYERLRAELDECRARVAELEAALRDALPFVAPDVSDIVREASDLDGNDGVTRSRNNRIRELRARPARVLSDTEGTT